MGNGARDNYRALPQWMFRDPQKGKIKYLESGQRYMEKGKYQEAAIQFQNALKLIRALWSLYRLAQAELAQHQWRRAYAALETHSN